MMLTHPKRAVYLHEPRPSRLAGLRPLSCRALKATCSGDRWKTRSREAPLVEPMGKGEVAWPQQRRQCWGSNLAHQETHDIAAPVAAVLVMKQTRRQESAERRRIEDSKRSRCREWRNRSADSTMEVESARLPGKHATDPLVSARRDLSSDKEEGGQRSRSSSASPYLAFDSLSAL